MEAIDNNHSYKTFLCYRRKKTEPKYALSEDIAGVLYWWLNHSPCFEKSRPALFEECYQTGGGLTYGENGIKTIVSSLETCFVVLCPEFFQRMMNVFRNVITYNLGQPEQELLQITRDQLSNKNKDICFLEIQHVLAAKECRVIPVLVRDGRRDIYSELNNGEICALKKIFGQGSEVLFDSINSCSVDYQELAPFLKGLDWAEVDEKTAKDRMEELEESEAGKSLKKCLMQILQVNPESHKVADIDCASLMADLNCCVHTFLEQQQPSGDTQDFRAGNPKVVYDPIRSFYMKNDPQIKPPFLADCLVESFNENKEMFGLPSDTFRYWNVNLSSTSVENNNQYSIPLSVCAVCFGTLSVYHYLTKERKYLKAQVTDHAPTPLLNTVQSGLNLLLALRNPYTKAWPSTWEFNNQTEESIGIEGTTNQTTLSLSTLMSCGFLAPDIAPEHLKARYEYVWESVSVLLNWGVSRDYDRRITGWRYTARARSAPALLPTIFVFDTLCKLRQCIRELIPVFSKDSPFEERLCKDYELVEEKLNEALAFIEQKQCGKDSRAPGAFRRFASREYSVTHTAYVIKSLYQYIQDHGEKQIELETILEPAVSYLINSVESMKRNGEIQFQDWEWCENFCDSDPNDEDDYMKSSYGEQYEHSAELIVGEALIKIAEHCHDEKLCANIMSLLQWLFEKYIEKKRVISVDGDTVRVRGIRDCLPYPIFCLYYYRMFLWDYLSLLDKKEA